MSRGKAVQNFAGLKKKILLVDDDQDLAELFLIGLERHYNVQVLLSVKDCLELLMSHKFIPDLFILDIHLNRGHGFALFEKIKQMPAFQQIPIVFISGDSEKYDSSFELGAFTFLPKPFDFSRLIEVIEEALETNLIVDES